MTCADSLCPVAPRRWQRGQRRRELLLRADNLLRLPSGAPATGPSPKPPERLSALWLLRPVINHPDRGEGSASGAGAPGPPLLKLGRLGAPAPVCLHPGFSFPHLGLSRSGRKASLALRGEVTSLERGKGWEKGYS